MSRRRILMRNGKWLLAIGEALPDLAPAPEPETVSQYRLTPDLRYNRQEERDALRKARGRARLRGRHG